MGRTLMVSSSKEWLEFGLLAHFKKERVCGEETRQKEKVFGF
jgi:hypothetical protein